MPQNRAKISKQTSERLLSILTQDYCFWNLAYVSWRKVGQIKKDCIDKKIVRFTRLTATILYQHYLQNRPHHTSDAVFDVCESPASQKLIIT